MSLPLAYRTFVEAVGLFLQEPPQAATQQELLLVQDARLNELDPAVPSTAPPSPEVLQSCFLTEVCLKAESSGLGLIQSLIDCSTYLLSMSMACCDFCC